MSAGTRLGRYELLRLLGRGGMAEVYLAKQFGPDGFEKPCVLKRINRESETDATHRALFLEEARLCGILNHPFIVQTFDYGEADGVPFMAMELVEGMNLSSLLRRMREAREKFPLRAGVELGQAMLEALGYAHRLQAGGRALGVVHRDVSPANILLSRQGIAKLADFGVARQERPEESTIGARVKGKIGYMSPEQARGEALDGRSDLFSLGIVMIEILSGQKVTEGHIPVGLGDYRRRVDALLADRDDLPKGVKSLVLWLVAERADERPPDAESAADLLRRMVDELPARDSLSRFLPVALEHHKASDAHEPASAGSPGKSFDRTNIDLPGRIPGSVSSASGTKRSNSVPASEVPGADAAADWLIPGDQMNKAEGVLTSMPPRRPSAVEPERPRSSAHGWKQILGDEAPSAPEAPAAEPEHRPWMANVTNPPPGPSQAPPSGVASLPLPPPGAASPSKPGGASPVPLAPVGTAPEGLAVDRMRKMFDAPPERFDSPMVVKALLGVAGIGAVIALVLFVRAGVFKFESSDASAGKISVSSDPPGAEIWLDGKPRGLVTPAEIEGLPVERAMVLEVKRSGFVARPESVLVEIPNDEFKASRANFTLDPVRTLVISSTPPGAEVFLEGKRLPGRTPLTLPHLGNGQEVKLEVQLEEFLPASLSLTIDTNTATTTEVTLVPATSFDVDVEPSGAAVFLNDVDVGRAPLFGLQVPAEQRFRLRAEAPGYKSQEKKIDPRRTKERRVVLKLATLPFSALPMTPEERRRIKDLEKRIGKLAEEVRFAAAKLQDREATYERVSARRGVSSAEMTSAISSLESARSRHANLERRLEETREELNAIKFELSERNQMR